ncbi:sulfite exporter TauE/SafE family protein [Geomonas subterranea]|uniref:Probable membrane transporter protein n=1 Tax=Geomonas subterranea TaxID=2847989 RepID=A0ABX8LLB2_9BACT|nr:sulfite exporter TauE/SafE family protein [Geomonas subterranea]QXE91424.1 sulfite exporter TauE/SafE family protein [Geomonas subterranea]QXM10488.1 sulfite exporter TauE/SafE family protein [Geomonas subterranea]
MLSPEAYFLLLAAIFTVAILYSSVGHGGASGYIGVLALFSIMPEAFKPTALILNIMVAAIATYSFAQAGHFSWRLFWPFATTSVPCSFIGGYLTVPPHVYKQLVGMVLLASACRLVFHKEHESLEIQRPATPVALVVGAVLGLLSGLTGVGGGIFLSPLLLLLKWGRAREASAIAALFILVNSIAGLLGHISSLQQIPPFGPLLALAAVLGGIIGSVFGSRTLPVAGVVKALSLVLAIAGLKLLFV